MGLARSSDDTLGYDGYEEYDEYDYWLDDESLDEYIDSFNDTSDG